MRTKREEIPHRQRRAMQTLLQDLRYPLQQLIKSPGFTLTAVISLAIGVGATTAVFSVIYAALMNLYPYPAADRIVRLTIKSKAGSSDWVNPNVLRFSNYGRNWLLARFRKPKAPTEESIRRYRERLLNSRWDELQEHFGLAIPEPLKNLYKQTTLLSKRQAAAVWTTKVRERCLGKKTA